MELFDVNDKRQGIVHIIGPEQGFTQPGTVIVCGDSHTATHGAFGALAFGIGTSEVEHVLATQTLIQKKSKNLRINVNGALPKGVTAKDVILKIIGTIGTAGFLLTGKWKPIYSEPLTYTAAIDPLTYTRGTFQRRLLGFESNLPCLI